MGKENGVKEAGKKMGIVEEKNEEDRGGHYGGGRGAHPPCLGRGGEGGRLQDASHRGGLSLGLGYFRKEHLSLPWLPRPGLLTLYPAS